ncbi:MAG: HAD hydrolase-like protein [Thermodesulfovibrionia bacterium]|nr:HAD hydrolase-like protein [Thermodesulfovibrionia bacterium]
MIKTILFDFDGVIVESVDIKTSAFEALFRNESKDNVAAILDFHRKHGGISRTNKILHFYSNILCEELSGDKLKELEDRFSRYVKEKVIQSPFVEGALEFIMENYGKYGLYIISGTPQAELEDIVSARDLGRYFKGVYGSPRGKAEIINALLSEKKFQKDNTVFIGDSADDLDGAIRSGVRFIARINPSREDTVFSLIEFPVIYNLRELSPALSRFNND